MNGLQRNGTVEHSILRNGRREVTSLPARSHPTPFTRRGSRYPIAHLAWRAPVRNGTIPARPQAVNYWPLWVECVIAVCASVVVLYGGLALAILLEP
jgi:hypothetical protein